MSHKLINEELAQAKCLAQELDYQMKLGVEFAPSLMRALDAYKSARDALTAYDKAMMSELLKERR